MLVCYLWDGGCVEAKQKWTHAAWISPVHPAAALSLLTAFPWCLYSLHAISQVGCQPVSLEPLRRCWTKTTAKPTDYCSQMYQRLLIDPAAPGGQHSPCPRPSAGHSEPSATLSQCCRLLYMQIGVAWVGNSQSRLLWVSQIPPSPAPWTGTWGWRLTSYSGRRLYPAGACWSGAWRAPSSCWWGRDRGQETRWWYRWSQAADHACSPSWLVSAWDAADNLEHCLPLVVLCDKVKIFYLLIFVW